MSTINEELERIRFPGYAVFFLTFRSRGFILCLILNEVYFGRISVHNLIEN